MTPNGLKSRPGGPNKIDENLCCGLGMLRGCLGVPPGSENRSKCTVTHLRRTSEKILRCCRSVGTRTKKIAMVTSLRRVFTATADDFVLSARLSKSWPCSRTSSWRFCTSSIPCESETCALSQMHTLLSTKRSIAATHEVSQCML